MKRLIPLITVVGLGAVALAQLPSDSSTPSSVSTTDSATLTSEKPAVPTTADPLSVEQVARLRNLNARPIHEMTNADLGEYLGLYGRVSKADPNRLLPHERMGHLGVRSVAQPYRLNAGRFDLAESDCVVFVERTIAMSLATDWESYMRLSERLRHKDGVVDYRNRNFATLADWMPSNSWLLRDITPELGPAQSRAAATFTHVVRPKVFEEVASGPNGGTRWVFKGSD